MPRADGRHAEPPRLGRLHVRQRHRDQAGDAIGRELDPGLAAMALQGALDQAHAEAIGLRHPDRRAAPFLPAQHQAAGLIGVDLPGDFEPAVAHRQGAVLAGVGRQLMQDHAEMERKLRIELDARPAGADAPVLAAGKHHLLANQVIDVGILEVRLGQQAVGPGERMHPAGEALDEILRPRRSGKRLGGDSLHHRHGVAHPVIELVDEEPLLDLEPLALGDVARHLGGADDRPEPVAQWRYGERDIDHAPVLGHPDGLVMVDHLAPAQPRQDLALLVMQLGRDEAGDRLADHLVRRIAENAGRTGVPRGDPALQRLADDGVVGGRDDCRKPRQLHVGFAPVGDLHQEIDGTGDPPLRIGQQIGPGLEPHPPAVRPLGYGLEAVHRPAFPQRHRHRAILMGHRPAVGIVKLPGTAPLRAGLGALPPQLRRGVIIEGDAAGGIGQVDRHRQHFEQALARNGVVACHDLRR